jgi:hypothetical protein
MISASYLANIGSEESREKIAVPLVDYIRLVAGV